MNQNQQRGARTNQHEQPAAQAQIWVPPIPTHKLPEYRVWQSMITRCTNPKAKIFHRYGGRGITVYPSWRSSFAAFYGYIGPRPSKCHSIDRINNDDGYNPGNVRWATWKEQVVNTSRNLFVELDGERLTVTQWSEKLGIPSGTIFSRIHRGDPPEKALHPGLLPRVLGSTGIRGISVRECGQFLVRIRGKRIGLYNSLKDAVAASEAYNVAR